MSIPLFKMNIKKNSILFLIFISVLSLYLIIESSMFNIENAKAMEDILKLLPVEVIKAFGMSNIGSSLVGYLASLFYGLLVFAFPLVYCVILSNRLVAKMVDNGSFSYLLSTPNSRTKIILTQGIYLLFSIVMLFGFLFLIGILSSNIMFKGLLDINVFFKINLTSMTLTMTVGMICFICSCLANDSKISLGLSTGINVFFLLVHMLSGINEKLSFLKNFTPYSLLDATGIANGNSILFSNIFYLTITVILFILSIYIFKQKKLSI